MSQLDEPIGDRANEFPLSRTRRGVAKTLLVLLLAAPPAHAEILGDAVIEMMKSAREGCDCRDACLMGTIVRQLDDGRYEVAAQLYMFLTGQGDRDQGRALTVLLKTKRTKFASKGAFSICINPTFSTSKAKGTDGFFSSYITLIEGKPGYVSEKQEGPAPRTLESGGIADAALLKGAMQENQAHFDRCIQQQEEREPNAWGTVLMRWRLHPNGTATDIEPASEYRDAPIAICLRAQLESMTFPSRAARPDPVEWPFQFGPVRGVGSVREEKKPELESKPKAFKLPE